MRQCTPWAVAMGLGCFLSLLLAPPVEARFEVGDLTGFVSDVEGEKLADAAVTLSGDGREVRVTTDEGGHFRFSDLKPGNYTIEITRDGFSPALYEPVNVRLGRTTTVHVQLSVNLEETIVVTSEPPTAAAGATTTDRALPAAELETIAAASDPWAAADRLAGVVTDRDQPAATGAPAVTVDGAGGRDVAVAVDGAVVREPGSSAADPRGTGGLHPAAVAGVRVRSGVDLTSPSHGVLLDLVTGRGGDRARASVHGVTSGRSGRSADAVPAAGGEPVTLSESRTTGADRILEISELGGEGSGRLIRDHLWAWGSHHQQRIRRRTTGGTEEDTRLRHTAVKLTSQLGASSAVATFHRGELRRSGEGAGPDRAPETTRLEHEPSRVASLESSHLLNPGFQLTAHLSQLRSGVRRTPLGAPDADVVLDENGVWQGSYGDLQRGVDADGWELEGAVHRRRGKAHHEVRFGFRDRRSDHAAAESWGELGAVVLTGENFGTPYDLVRLVRPSRLEVERNRFAFWIQDTITRGRLTIDLGLRHDLQRGRSGAAAAAANPLFPELLPGFEAEGGERVEWGSVSPRLAVAWALDRRAATVLRASWSSYSSPLYADLVSRVATSAGAELYLGFEDLGFDGFDGFGGDRRPSFNTPYFILGGEGVDPRMAGAQSPHRNHLGLDPEETVERRLELERSFGTGVQLGLELLERRRTGIHEIRRLVRDADGTVRPATAADYRLDTVLSGLLPDGSGYAVPLYSLREGLEDTGGNLLRNGDRSQLYRGATLRFEKRLEDRWTVRAQLTVSDRVWQVGRFHRLGDDPTDAAVGVDPDAEVDLADNDGDVVVEQALGDRIFLNSRWSFDVFALYQLAPRRPWGFDAALHLRGREGFPIPYSVTAVGSDGSVQGVQVTPRTDTFRLEDVYTVDLRLQKELPLGPLRAALSLDAFNLLDEGYVLQRETQLNSPQGGAVRETLSPRVFRFGVRLSWR